MTRTRSVLGRSSLTSSISKTMSYGTASAAAVCWCGGVVVWRCGGVVAWWRGGVVVWARTARLGQQHVELPRHPPRHWVDGEGDLDAGVAELGADVGDGVLRLRHRQAVCGSIFVEWWGQGPVSSRLGQGGWSGRLAG